LTLFAAGRSVAAASRLRGGRSEVRMFGKKWSEYIAFEKAGLFLIAVVGILRLGLSIAGVPDATVKWLSLTGLGAALVVYYAVAVHTKGFGSYRQLLPLYFLQGVLAHAIIITGIAIAAMTGKVNIYAANEYGGSAGAGIHMAAHTAAMLIGPLLSWIVGSIVLFVTKRVVKAAPRPTAAPA
jgi:hypothetical protein